MELSVINKVGVALLVVGCCLVLGLDWLGPVAIVVGLSLIILGFFLAFHNRSSNHIRDDSAGTGGKLYDDD